MYVQQSATGGQTLERSVCVCVLWFFFVVFRFGTILETFDDITKQAHENPDLLHDRPTSISKLTNHDGQAPCMTLEP